jgi:hypothetical protein
MDTYSWIGCEGVARVKHEEDDKGKMRARVDSFAPREEEEPKAKPKQAKASQAGTKKKPAKVVEEGWDFKDNGPEFPELDPEMIKVIEEESDVPF